MMETFPIVKRRDEKLHGEYRTKRAILLEIYDSIKLGIGTGEPYLTVWQQPADPSLAHSPRIGMNVIGALRKAVALVTRATAMWTELIQETVQHCVISQ